MRHRQKSARLKILLKDLKAAIREIEKKIQKIIEGDETLSHQFKLLCSIDGVGERTAVKAIVETNALRDFTDARKFCCHAGLAPFSYTSGAVFIPVIKSLIERTKVLRRFCTWVHSRQLLA
ncbi:hypothetical protein EZS27_043283 [termite gut metagenome]|uniref:Transposase IS116/IS110/IS902 C-terminal domain-containing protein n=1 Tax=termite gut metagenome TaxID=433724 RepID=A0A5J4P6Q3_9ZZZZ